MVGPVKSSTRDAFRRLQDTSMKHLHKYLHDNFK